VPGIVALDGFEAASFLGCRALDGCIACRRMPALRAASAARAGGDEHDGGQEDQHASVAKRGLGLPRSLRTPRRPMRGSRLLGIRDLGAHFRDRSFRPLAVLLGAEESDDGANRITTAHRVEDVEGVLCAGISA